MVFCIICICYLQIWLLLGGTVYHDGGNLNCSFFTSRARYNRKSNLQTICQSLKNHWNLDLTISSREDILFNTYKVSGTASKLGHRNAYHHWSAMFSHSLWFCLTVLLFLCPQYSTCWRQIYLASSYVACTWGMKVKELLFIFSNLKYSFLLIHFF